MGPDCLGRIQLLRAARGSPDGTVHHAHPRQHADEQQGVEASGKRSRE